MILDADVHMREPRRLLRNLGPSGFFAFQLIVRGNALAALIHPLFLAGLIYGVLAGVPMWESGVGAGAILVRLYGAALVAG
jgi:glycosyltransferase XagB